MRFFGSSKLILAGLFFASIFSFLPYFWNGAHPLGSDWHYANGMSITIRSCVLEYGVFPLHDPWCGGGRDLLNNPQNRIFSPLILLDLVFSPQIANVLGLWLQGLIGILGLYLLLRRLAVSPGISATAAVLFVNGSWFTLRHLEGHIPHGAFQILPWLLICALSLQKRMSRFGVAALLTYFLLDGAVYVFGFGLLLIVGVAFFNRQEIRFKEYLGDFATLSILMVLTCAIKLVPSLAAHANRAPTLDNTVLPLKILLTSLFFPRQSVYMPELTRGTLYQFHEYGCYIGLVGCVVIAMAARNCAFRKENTLFLIGLGLSFWISTGWGDPINPWRILQQLPLFSSLHLQSRVFVFFLLFFCILLARSLALLPFSRGSKLLVCSFLLLESFFVRYHVDRQLFSSNGTNPYAERFQARNITRTVAEANPMLLASLSETASADCYDPSFRGKTVLYEGHPKYQGMVEPPNSAKILEYIPGSIHLSYPPDLGDLITINTACLSGWNRTNGVGSPECTTEGRLAIRPDPRGGEIVLRYQRSDLKFLLLAWILGLAGWIFTWVKWSQEPSHKRPVGA